MRIATWNVERLKHKKHLEQMQDLCDSVHADILVLTETDKRLHPNYAFCCESAPLLEDEAVHYAVTENRVSIYTNYPVIQLHQTYEPHTAVCAELKTEAGNLLVYGTIIGTLGNRHPSFMEELRWQLMTFAVCPNWAMGYVCAAILTVPSPITTISHKPVGQHFWICFEIQA